MKETNQNIFKQFPEEIKEILSAICILCTEGLSIDVVCNIICTDDTKYTEQYIHQLNDTGWINIDNNDIYSDSYVTETILEVYKISDERHLAMLNALHKHINLQPLDDMYAKCEYFKAARVYLTYLKDTWKNRVMPSDLVKAFADNVICFAKNVELSYRELRVRNTSVDERIDFILLFYALSISGANHKGDIETLLGNLYNQNFKYEKAKEHLNSALKYVSVNLSMLKMTESKMYEHLGIYWKAILLAYEAYEINEIKGNRNNNLSVCLYIAYLCGINESEDNAKYWLNKFWEIMNGRTIPEHHLFNIKVNEIEALIHKDDTKKSTSLIERAEYETFLLYGTNAPEFATIYAVRQFIDVNAEKIRQAAVHYCKYVDINHYNYGNSVGDVAVMYSFMVISNTFLSNVYTTSIYNELLDKLNTNEEYIAPGVRLCLAQAKFFGLLISLCDFNKAEEQLKICRKIYEEEIMPNDDSFTKKKHLILPANPNVISFLATDLNNDNNSLEYLLHYLKGDTEKAKEFLQGLIASETDKLQKLKYMIKLGNVLAVEEDKEEARKIWKDVLEQTEKKDIFSMCLDIAEHAETQGMMYEALEYIDIALQFDNMVYAKNYELASALTTQAELRKYYNFENSEEPWKDAEKLLESIGNTDSLSNLYISWSELHQDLDKVNFLRKAIELWKPEQGLYDEKLSTMYYKLTKALAAIGEFKEAQTTAKRAVELFPVEYPTELREEIKEFL